MATSIDNKSITKTEKESEFKYHGFSIDTIKKYVECASYPNMQIISIGSGNGLLECKLEKLLNKKIICIDPEPEYYKKYDSKEFLKPHYPTVEKMLECKDNHKYINNCCLLISWAYPINQALAVSTYDVDAIRILKPKSMIVLYEINGCAGSPYFLNWTKGFVSETSIVFKLDYLLDLKLLPTEIYREIAKKDLKVPKDDYQTECINTYQTIERVQNNYKLGLIKKENYEHAMEGIMLGLQKTTSNRILYLAKKGSKINTFKKNSLIDK